LQDLTQLSFWQISFSDFQDAIFHVSAFFSISCRPFAHSSYPFQGGLSSVGSGVLLPEFFLLPEMQTQLCIFDFRNLLCSQVSKFLSSVDFTALRLKEAKYENPEKCRFVYLSIQFNQNPLRSAWSRLYSTATSSVTSSLHLN